MNRTELVSYILSLTNYKRSVNPEIVNKINRAIDKYDKKIEEESQTYLDQIITEIIDLCEKDEAFLNYLKPSIRDLITTIEDIKKDNGL